MNNNATDIVTTRSVIAMAKADNTLRTVELRKKNGVFEVLWTKSSEGADTDWRVFAAECGLSIGPTAQADTDGGRMVVVGFDSAAMAFYRMSMPAVAEQELAAIVKLQAETRLPLGAEQMELAWRPGQIQNGQIGVTIAAARKTQLQAFIENVQSFRPAKILLDCEGIIKVWRAFFSGNEGNAVVVSAGVQNTQVCLAEDGRLSNAVVLDMGTADFAAGGAEQQTETFQRFTQDMSSVLDLFGYTQSNELPVFVLSDGSADYVSMVSSLRSAGLNARVALPDTNKLRTKGKPGVEGIYEYRVPIGLGLMAFEAGTDELNVFERLYSPSRRKGKRHWLYSPQIAGAIAAAMLVLLVIVSYAVDVASPGAIEERLVASGSEADINQLMQRQKLIKTVAQQRPDLVELLYQINRRFLFGVGLKFQSNLDKGIISEELRREFEKNDIRLSQDATVSVEQADSIWLISDRSKKYSVRKQARTLEIYSTSDSGGIKLASFLFKKGQRVSISGQAPGNAQLYEFEKSLEGRKSIRDVRRTANTASKDAKSKKLTFTMTFHYKNFTK